MRERKQMGYDFTLTINNDNDDKDVAIRNSLNSILDLVYGEVSRNNYEFIKTSVENIAEILGI